MRAVALPGRAFAVFAAAGAMAAAGLTAALPAQAATSRAPLPGTRPVWATAAHQVAAGAPASGAVSARVYLAGRNPAGLAAYAAEVSNPKSPLYRQFLSPAQARARFGPTVAQISSVRGWLTRAGLKVTGQTSHYLAVSGSSAAASAAFRVSFATYRTPSGQLARAPRSNASVPASLSRAVLTVTGLDTARSLMKPLDTLPPPGPNFYIAKPCSRYWGQQVATDLPSAYGRHLPYAVCGYTPRQLRGAYGVTGTGLTGRGVRIAVVDAFASPTMLADANAYARTVGEAPFRPGQYSQVLPSAYDQVNACGGNGWYGEETLDVEAAHGMAPNADVVYVGAADCTDQGLLDAETTIVDNHLADIVTNSWGETEDQTTGAMMAAYDQIFQLGAVEGIGFNFSSGDCGYEDPANACGANRDGSDKIQVDWPTSSPWVTSVGGTSLGIGRENNYQFQTSWGVYQVDLSANGTSWASTPPGVYPGNYTSGSGGGVSTIFTQPFYQRGVVPNALATHLPDGATSATPMRVVPDISADADPQTGFAVGETTQLPDGSYGFTMSRTGGTSLASPLAAGVMADLMQAARHSLGFANPLLYLAYRSPLLRDVTDTPFGPGNPVAVARNDYTDPFTATGPIVHSLRTTGMDGGGNALLSAGRGYDDATGLGSLWLGALRWLHLR